MSNAEEYITKRRMEIAQNMRVFRRKKGWSQAKVAECLGCSRKRVNRAERGIIDLALGEFELIATALGVETCRLLNITG